MKRTLPHLLGFMLAVCLLGNVPAFADGNNEKDLGLFDGSGWSFNSGPEFPGATGSFQLQKVDDQKALVLAYNFSAGGGYVAARIPVAIEDGWTQLQFQAKGDRNLKLVVRLIDSTNQVHQYPLLYDQPNQWEPLKVFLMTPAPHHFSGANDGVIHYPIKELWLCVGKGGTTMSSPGNASFAAAKLTKQ